MFLKKLFFPLMGVLFLLLYTAELRSQDLLYFCEKYTDREIGTGDRFTTGNLTVMVKLDLPIFYENVSIQWDKLNCKTGNFEYANSKSFTVDGNWTYMFFDGINFAEPGIYRVFLLDPAKNTMVSGLVEIIRK